MTVVPIRVLSVDDHEFLVDGLKARLEIEADIEFVGRLSSADDLTREVKRLGVTIILMDIEMPGADPFDALSELRQQCPDVRAIMLSAYVRDHYIDAAYKAGTWGYLAKSDSPDHVVDGIRRVAAGELAASGEVRERSRPPAGSGSSVATMSKLSLLTPRETQLLRMIARGMSRTDIAEQLSRSPMTVDDHRKSIMKKLCINDRADLVRFAIAERLVEV